MNNELAKQALQSCVAAMQKSRDEGCTDHLDCCDDGGQFWYDAIENAEKALAALAAAEQQEPVLDVWVDPITLGRSYLSHGTPLAPFDKREYVGALVWATDPDLMPLNRPSEHVIANLVATTGYRLTAAPSQPAKEQQAPPPEIAGYCCRYLCPIEGPSKWRPCDAEAADYLRKNPHLRYEVQELVVRADKPEQQAQKPSGPGLGDDIPCEKCGAVALDTGLECDECGHDNYQAVMGRPFGTPAPEQQSQDRRDQWGYCLECNCMESGNKPCKKQGKPEQQDDAIAKNAARYEWLRNEANRDYVEFMDRWFELDSDLDAAIDAAMQQDKKGGE